MRLFTHVIQVQRTEKRKKEPFSVQNIQLSWIVALIGDFLQHMGSCFFIEKPVYKLLLSKTVCHKLLLGLR